jgi:hypothetical protein
MLTSFKAGVRWMGILLALPLFCTTGALADGSLPQEAPESPRCLGPGGIEQLEETQPKGATDSRAPSSSEQGSRQRADREADEESYGITKSPSGQLSRDASDAPSNDERKSHD